MVAYEIVRQEAAKIAHEFIKSGQNQKVIEDLLFEFYRRVVGKRERDPEERINELLCSNNELRDRAMEAERKLKEIQAAPWRFLKVVTDSDWETVEELHAVPTHTRVVGGVLCRWWGAGDPPPGVEMINHGANWKPRLFGHGK